MPQAHSESAYGLALILKRAVHGISLPASECIIMISLCRPAGFLAKTLSAPGRAVDRSDQVCARLVPRANPVHLDAQKVATLWPIFCSTDSYLFLRFMWGSQNANCPRSAGAVRNRTMVTVLGSVPRVGGRQLVVKFWVARPRTLEPSVLRSDLQVGEICNCAAPDPERDSARCPSLLQIVHNEHRL